MKTSIYISEENMHVINRALEFSGKSLSVTIIEAMKVYVRMKVIEKAIKSEGVDPLW